MKKNKVVVVIVVVLVFLCGQSFADEVRGTRINLAKKSVGFVGGLASGFLFHEANHEIMARIEGADMSWSDGRWAARTSGGSLRNIAWAGFSAQVISTEAILGFDKIPKDNAYVLGWLTYNVFNFFLYPVRNELQGGYGDLETLRRTGVNTSYVEVGMIAYGLLTAYRVYHNPKFIPYVKATKEEIIFGVGWRF